MSMIDSRLKPSTTSTRRATCPARPARGDASDATRRTPHRPVPRRRRRTGRSAGPAVRTRRQYAECAADYDGHSIGEVCRDLHAAAWSTLRSIRLVPPTSRRPQRDTSRTLGGGTESGVGRSSLVRTALLLSGCSWSEALGLGWPNGITPEAHLNRELWIGSVIASLVVGVIVWGLIFWTVGVPPAQEERHRTAAPVRLQHAAGAGAHRRAVPDHLGALLLHRRGAGEDAAQGAQPRGRHRRHGVPVELEVRLPEGRLQRRHARATTAPTPSARPPWRPSPRASTQHGEELVGRDRGT